VVESEESLGYCFDKALSAHSDITFVATDFDLFALFDRVTFGVCAEIHGSLATALADGL
jgi:hypothetical protein